MPGRPDGGGPMTADPPYSCWWMFDDGGRMAAGFRGDAGDCVTRAVAIATGRDYRTVYDELFERLRALPPPPPIRRSGNVRRRSPRSGIPKSVVRAYITDPVTSGGHGWIWTPTMGFGTGTTVHLRADELPGGRLIASCSKHLVAVIDGVIHDTHDPSRDGTRAVYGHYTPPKMIRL